MTPKEKKALDRLKSVLYDYPETLMTTVLRGDLEIVVNCLEKENKKTLTAGKQSQ